MKTEKSREILLSVIILAVAAFYTVMTLIIPVKSSGINARTVPYILCAGMWLLGIFQFLNARKSDTKKPAGEAVDKMTVLKTAVLIMIYIGFFEMAGFLLMTSIYLFLQFIILIPSESKINYWVYGIIAVAMSAFVYFTFRYGLDIMLPQGIIGIF